jgi:hypothetical protein
MTKILTALSLLIVTASAGLFSTVSGMRLKEIKPTSSHTLDTVGFNPRIYEFTSSNKDMYYVLVFSSSDNSSTPTMQCVKVNK